MKLEQDNSGSRWFVIHLVEDTLMEGAGWLCHAQGHRPIMAHMTAVDWC